jgi:hypothetical protein
MVTLTAVSSLIMLELINLFILTHLVTSLLKLTKTIIHVMKPSWASNIQHIGFNCGKVIFYTLMTHFLTKTRFSVMQENQNFSYMSNSDQEGHKPNKKLREYLYAARFSTVHLGTFANISDKPACLLRLVFSLWSVYFSPL